MTPEKEPIKPVDKGTPPSGELVIGTISKVMPYGAFVKIEEYPGAEGMIHVSEIATKWVKNIKEFVNEGDRIVVRVLRVNRDKGHIDLSLKSVKASQKKQKLEEEKRTLRAHRFLELVAEAAKDKTPVQQIMDALEKVHGEAFAAIETIAVDGKSALENVELPAAWKKPLVSMAQEQMKPPDVIIKAILTAQCPAPNGIEVLAKSVGAAEKKAQSEDTALSIKYIGAPRYQLEVTAPDYKKAERSLATFEELVQESLKKTGGEAEVIRA